jgi:hypothetical protein
MAKAAPAAWRLRLASRRAASASSSMRWSSRRHRSTSRSTRPASQLGDVAAGREQDGARGKAGNRRRHARGVELGDIKIDQGQLSYGKAATGQTHGRQERHVRCRHGEFGKPARAISARRLRISASICRSKAAPKRGNPASQRRPAPISDSRPRSLASSCRRNCSGNSVRSLFFPHARALQSRSLRCRGHQRCSTANMRRSAPRGTGGVRRAARRAATDSGAEGLRRRSALADGRRRPGQRHPCCWCGSRRKGSTVSAPASAGGRKTGSRR